MCIGDAVELMDRLAPGSLAGIRAYFPDPWPKVRHHKRRLVQPAFVHRAAVLLAPGGTLHLATDIAHYADQMLDVCSAEPLLDVGHGADRRPAVASDHRLRAAGDGRRSPSATSSPRGAEPSGR